MDPSDADSFAISGPAHLRDKTSDTFSIDWENEEHRRCVAACLVKGTYVLENDRRKGRDKTAPLAPEWWESFQFGKHTELRDKGTIFGAIFEVTAEDMYRRRHPSAPRYVVAFRGTNKSNVRDLLHDVFVVTNILKSYSSRYKLAHDAVGKLLPLGAGGTDDASVWLTGHSLGASMALCMGRAMMADRGSNLPAFLFNPPQVSLWPAMSLLSSLTNLQIAGPLHKASCWIKFAIGGSKVLKPGHHESRVTLFDKLSPWVPELFVNDHDVICSGFIEQFHKRQNVHELSWSTEALSLRDMAASVLGAEMEQPHLLPSARLWRSKSEGSNVLNAHEIQQWWKKNDDLELTTTSITKQYSCPLAINQAPAPAAAISDT